MSTLGDFMPDRAYCQEGKAFKAIEASDVPKVDRPRYLWHSGYYDGPLSGMCLHNEEKCWFQCVDEVYYRDEEGEGMAGRVFVIIRLTAEDIAEEEYWHELFREHVGTHTDYGENQKRDLTGTKVKAQKNHHLFYDKAKERKDRSYKDRPVVAWYGNAHWSFDIALTDVMQETDG